MGLAHRVADDTLVARIQARDEAAFEQLLTRHLNSIHGYVMRLVGSSADADEITQETFLRLWAKADTYQQGQVQFSTWLHRIAYNLCTDHLRRRRSEPLEDPDEAVASMPGPERLISDREQAELVGKTINGLPEQQRSALLLCEMQGFSIKQAAEIMSLSVRAVESLLARARRSLRERMLQS